MTMLVDYRPETQTQPTAEPSPDAPGNIEPGSVERRRLRRVNVRSVVVVAAVFNVVLGVAFFIAGWLVLGAASHAGLFDSTPSPAGTASHVDSPSRSQLTLAWAGIVVVWTLVMTAVWGLAAVVLNWSATAFGGIEVEVDSRPSEPL